MGGGIANVPEELELTSFEDYAVKLRTATRDCAPMCFVDSSCTLFLYTFIGTASPQR